MSPQSMWGHIFLSFRSMHGKFMAKHTILTSFNKRGGVKQKQVTIFGKIILHLCICFDVITNLKK